jgi:hypothetical protein
MAEGYRGMKGCEETKRKLNSLRNHAGEKESRVQWRKEETEKLIIGASTESDARYRQKIYLTAFMWIS